MVAGHMSWEPDGDRSTQPDQCESPMRQWQ